MSKVNRVSIGELAARVALLKSGRKKTEVKDILEDSFKEIISILTAGDEFGTLKFGTLGSKKRLPRKVRNPQTGAFMELPEARVPYFKASKAMKDAVNGNTSVE